MNGLILMACTIVALFVGYRFYARWLENTWGTDADAKTPAQLKNDGNDFVPTNKWTVFSHQFTSITGAGPVTGPIIAAMFGWLPATHLLRCRAGLHRSVCFREKRRQIDGDDDRTIHRPHGSSIVPALLLAFHAFGDFGFLRYRGQHL